MAEANDAGVVFYRAELRVCGSDGPTRDVPVRLKPDTTKRLLRRGLALLFFRPVDVRRLAEIDLGRLHDRLGEGRMRMD